LKPEHKDLPSVRVKLREKFKIKPMGLENIMNSTCYVFRPPSLRVVSG
jgi:hypothetical protein